MNIIKILFIKSNEIMCNKINMIKIIINKSDIIILIISNYINTLISAYIDSFFENRI